MTLSMFVVFHDTVYAPNTAAFTADEVRACFTWAAVNEKIPKTVPDCIPRDLIVEEWALSDHDPTYQMLNYNENSFILHAFHNRSDLLRGIQHVGFSQYDHEFTREFMDVVHATANDASLAVGFFPSRIDDIVFVERPGKITADWMTLFFSEYNAYHGTALSVDDLRDIPICLLNTYVVPTWFFADMVRFVKTLFPKFLRALQWNPRHFGGSLERAFGLTIACAAAEKKINLMLAVGAILNRTDQRFYDPFRDGPAK